MVVSPVINSEVEALVSGDRLIWVPRAYRQGDLTGAFLAVAATDSEEVNSVVARDAKSLGILCCVASRSDLGNTIMPSVLRRGDLLLSVTTSGASPALSRTITERLAEEFGPEYGEFVSILRDARLAALAANMDATAYRDLMRRLADDEITLDLVRDGRAEQARARAMACILPSSD